MDEMTSLGISKRTAADVKGELGVVSRKLKDAWIWQLLEKLYQQGNNATISSDPSYGDMQIDVPKDQNVEFKLQIVKKYQDTIT